MKELKVYPFDKRLVQCYHVDDGRSTATPTLTLWYSRGIALSRAGLKAVHSCITFRMPMSAGV